MALLDHRTLRNGPWQVDTARLLALLVLVAIWAAARRTAPLSDLFFLGSWAILFGLVCARFASRSIWRIQLLLDRLIMVATLAVAGTGLLSVLPSAIDMPLVVLAVAGQTGIVPWLMMGSLLSLVGLRWLLAPVYIHVPAAMPHDVLIQAVVYLGTFLLLRMLIEPGSVHGFDAETWETELLSETVYQPSLAIETLLSRIQDLLGGERTLLSLDRVDQSDLLSPCMLQGGVLVPIDDERAVAVRRLDGELADRKAPVVLFDVVRKRLVIKRGNGLLAVHRSRALDGDTGQLTGNGGYALQLRVQDRPARAYVIAAPALSGLERLIAARPIITRALERLERLSAWRQRTLIEARQQLGRDLHDTVLQTLAAVRMQIAATRTRARDPEIVSNLTEIEATLEEEQLGLRAMIAESGGDAAARTELFSYLRRRLESLSRQWGVRCSIEMPEMIFSVTQETAIECEFLMREVFSNAVRHSHASQINAKLGISADLLLINFRSNGRALPSHGARAPGPAPTNSASLASRVSRLGGQIYSDALKSGNLISIRLPLERS